MFRKAIASLFALMMVFGVCIQTGAAGPLDILQDKPAGDVSPLWVLIKSVNNSLSINGSGYATMTASITTYDADSVRIDSYLQRNESGTWVVVDSWSQSYPAPSANWSKGKYVSQGYWYRLVTIFYAYKDSTTEFTTRITPSVWY